MSGDLATPRDLAKRITSFGWALCIAPIRSVLGFFVPDQDAKPAADALFHAGDTLQRGIVDLTFAIGLGAYDTIARPRSSK